MKYEIRPFDRMQFWVKSRNGRGEYLVDLTTHGGNGSCTCPHFRCRLEPKVKDGKDFRCKHIAGVRDFLADSIIERMVEYEAEKIDPAPLTNGEKRGANMEYLHKRSHYLAENALCAVFEGKRATDIHHMRGRAGELLLCEEFWLPVSREGHMKIHENPDWARSKGYLCDKGLWGKQPN